MNYYGFFKKAHALLAIKKRKENTLKHKDYVLREKKKKKKVITRITTWSKVELFDFLTRKYCQFYNFNWHRCAIELNLSCEDTAPNCVKHSERCDDPAYRTVLRKQCRKSCRICGKDWSDLIIFQRIIVELFVKSKN